MKTLIVILSLFLVSIYFTGCNRYNYPFREQQIPATAIVQEGQVLFMRYCQKCHPFGEAGLGPSIFYLPSAGKKIQARLGLGAMPAFDAHVLPADELDKITKYLKELK